MCSFLHASPLHSGEDAVHRVGWNTHSQALYALLRGNGSYHDIVSLHLRLFTCQLFTLQLKTGNTQMNRLKTSQVEEILLHSNQTWRCKVAPQWFHNGAAGMAINKWIWTHLGEKDDCLLTPKHSELKLRLNIADIHQATWWSSSCFPKSLTKVKSTTWQTGCHLPWASFPLEH